MLHNTNAVTGILENYVADVAVTVVFGLGYYLFKGLKKREETWSDPKQNLKNLKFKLEGALERWQYAKTIEDYNDLIKTNYEGVKDPFMIINIMNSKGILPTIETYNALLYNCLISNNTNSAKILQEEILDQTGPVTPNIYTLNILIKGLGLKFKNSLNNTNNLPLIFKKFDEELVEIIQSLEMRNVYMDVIASNTILDILIEQNRLNEAWNQFTNMKKMYKPDLYTFTCMLRGIKKANELSEEWLTRAFLILNEAKSMFSSENLDEKLTTLLLDACVKFNRTDKAEELFEEIYSSKKPSEHAYGIMIKAYSKVYKIDKCIEMFENIKQITATPSAQSYSALLNAYIRCKKIIEAENLIHLMEENNIQNINHYSQLISGYRITKNYEKALKVYEKLILREEELNISLYNSVLECCVDSNQINKMEEIFDKIEKASNITPDIITYSTVVKGFAKANNISRISEIYTFIKQSSKLEKMDEMLYNTIIDLYVRANDETNANNVFQDMKKNKVSISVITYTNMIKLFCLKKNCNKAFELFDECVKAEIKPNFSIYLTLIKLQLENKFIDRGITLFRNMIYNQIKPDQVIYELMILECLTQLREKEATDFTILAISEDFKFEDNLYTKLVDGIIASDCSFSKRSGKVEYACKLLEALTEKGIKINKLSYAKLNALIEINSNHFNSNNNNYQPNYQLNYQPNYQNQQKKRYSSPNETSIYNLSLEENRTNSYKNNNYRRNTHNNYAKPHFTYNSHHEEKSLYS
jgi:pentatricopeptide repeat protein